jgi:hypothetical protein
MLMPMGLGGLQAEMSEEHPIRVDESGLDLWFGPDLDLPIWALHEKPCAVCGGPAKVATRRLNEQHRRFLCDDHRTTK